MRAIQVTTPGGPEVLTLAELPVPEPKAGEALVEIKASGVNFIDVYYREGRYKAPLPFVDGQEGAGIVAALGAGVEGLRPGDRVAYSGVLGSYAEFAAVPAEKLVKIPMALTFEQAAAAMLQGLTARYLSHETFPIAAGQTVLIHAAAGGVGNLLVQMAKHRGAQVIATAGTEAKAELAREAGADRAIVYTKDDFTEATKEFTAGKGVDVVYDGVGRETFEKGLRLLKPRGMMVLFGASSGAVPPLDPLTLMTGGSLFLTRPTLGHYIATRAELEKASSELFSYLAKGWLKLRIGATYPLAKAELAHRDLEARRSAGKLLLRP
jgi:NADPH2:quinone reductase